MNTIRLTASLTEEHHKKHVPLRFEIPEGTTRIAGTLSLSPQRSAGALFDNMVCLSIFGPAGPRGARHNNPATSFSLDAMQATPGYTAGAIEPGEWTVMLDCFRVIAPGPLLFTLDITLSEEPVPAVAPRPLPTLAPRGPGWYRGDLHGHSLHSDGSWDIPDVVAWAKDNALDFVTLTDHNTVSGLAEMDSLADDSLLTMGGLEMTTHYGHALALGTRQWLEWRAGSHEGLTMPELARRAMAAGATYVIAHPEAPGDPSCTGCHWDFEDMRPGPARLVEVWNGPWEEHNEDSLALYYTWLNAGLRLAATCGTDIHGPDQKPKPNPFNNVHAEERSETAILAAIAAGRNFLSSGPRLTLEVENRDGVRMMMGGVAASAGEAHVAFADAPSGARLRLVINGERLADEPAEDAADRLFDVSGMAVPGWIAAELRAADGDLLAFANPVFVGAN
ncbi:MAG: CehA/McbA family metallohydrolase [Beijerinckiaceae bacterium]